MTRSIWTLIGIALISGAALGQQTHPVYQDPNVGKDQKIVQTANTIFSSNNIDGIAYLDVCANSSCVNSTPSSYNWSQKPSGSISVGLNTVTLNPCPAGIIAPPTGGVFQPSTEVWLHGAPGADEAVLVTSTNNCPLQGSASSGTVTFMAANRHNAGYTISSASSGIQEAINAANFNTNNNPLGSTYAPQNGAVVIPPGEYLVNARITVLGSRQNIEGSGAILTCNMADACLFIGDYNNATYTSDVVVNGISFRPGEPGDHFAMIEDSAQHTTIRNIRGQNPIATGRFDTMLQIDNDQSTVIEGLDANSYGSTAGGKSWAACTTSSGSYTFCSNIVQGANNNVNGGANASVISIKNSVLDAQCYANGVDLGTAGGGSGAAATVTFSNGGVSIISLQSGGLGYMSAFPVTFPAPPQGGVTASGFATVSNGAVTGVVVTRPGSGYPAQTASLIFGGGFANTLKITDSVVQAYPQFGLRYKATYPNLGLILDNVYQEVGNCVNPVYPSTLQSQAGVIALGPIIRNTGGAAGAGNVPAFVGVPSDKNNKNYVYWIVGHNTAFSAKVTPPLLAGLVSLDTSGSAHTTVYWPQMCQLSSGSCGTVTYDVIRVLAQSNGQIIVPTHISGIGTDNGLVATVNSQNCNTSGVCSYTDNFGNLSKFDIASPPFWNDALAYWPGGFILTGNTENEGWQYGARLYTDVLAYGGSPMVSSVAGIGGVPTVYAQDCSGGPVIGSPLWMSCLATDSAGGNNQNDGPTILQNGGDTTIFQTPSPKGRIILEGYGLNMGQQDLITLGDSDYGNKLFASPGLRPAADPGDCAISADNGNTTNWGLAFRCPFSISNYINSMPDGTSWKEQLSTSGKTFNTPITANQPITALSQIISTVKTGTAPFAVQSSTPVQNLTSQAAQGLSLTGTTTNPIGGNQLGAGVCASGTATVTGAASTMTAVASPVNNPLAGSTQGLAIWGVRISNGSSHCGSMCHCANNARIDLLQRPSQQII